jgi:hypothetical protein
MRGKWEIQCSTRLPSSIEQVMQHLLGRELVQSLQLAEVQRAMAFSCRLAMIKQQQQQQQQAGGHQDVAKSPQPNTQQHLDSSVHAAAVQEPVFKLAVLLTHPPGNVTSGSSSSSTLCAGEVEVRLACIAVLARTMRLYGAVLQAALGHACFSAAASAEAREAGAAQLAQQLALPKNARVLSKLPQPFRVQLQQGGRQYLSTPKGAAAVIGELLSDDAFPLTEAAGCCQWLRQQLGVLQGPLQLPQQPVQSLDEQSSKLEVQLNEVLGLALGEAREGSSTNTEDIIDGHNSGEGQGNQAGNDLAGSIAGTSDAAAVAAEAVKERPWVKAAAASCGAVLGVDMQRWADAVCAALPSRRCCSNPRCVVLRKMSESNLVNGKACCCRGCSAADQAVRYCSRDCQDSH